MWFLLFLVVNLSIPLISSPKTFSFMRENYLRKILLLFLSLFCITVFAQDISVVGTNNVNKMKKQGQLTGMEHYTNRNATPLQMQPPVAPNTPLITTACACWIPRDATWQVAQFDGSGGSGGPGLPPDYRNDDWSTVAIPLPFHFCFYGQTVDSIYINNNGNVSIGGAYSTFTALSFPDTSYTMIAPFWADVDTRGPLSGIVYYKIAPKYMIIQWENVGYFGTHDDLLNTFQLILTDGTDPIINIGQNVAFCYKDMQWTTGDASQGSGGFGGVPATVGVNQGNGIDYIQFGLFDAAGSVYDGPYGSNDGVDWLDGQSFVLNACVSSANIPPVLNSLNVCDTIHLCENDTNLLTMNYLAPEQGENTTITWFSPGFTGVSVVSNTPGNTATLVLQIIGSASNLGYHTLAVTATDNGTPAAATSNIFVVEIMPAPLPSYTYSPLSPIQANTVVTFTNTSPVVAGAIYTWDFGDGSAPSVSTNALHNYANAGTFNAVLSVTYPNGCTTTYTEQIIVTTCTPATFTVTNPCDGDPSTITFTSVAGPGAVFTWDFNGGTILSGSGPGPYSVSWPSAGTYNVSLDVTEPTCSSAVVVPVTVYPIPAASITPVAPLCVGDNSNVSFNGTAGAMANYTWTFGSATVVSGSGSGPYQLQYNSVVNDQITLIVDENGCSDTTSIAVVVNPIPTSTFTVPPAACANDSLVVNFTGTAGAGATYNWDFNGAAVNSGSGQGPYSVSWNAGGNFNITLTVTENGCTSVQSGLPVAITDIPVVSITAVPALCVGETGSVNFTGVAGAGAAFNWNFGSASVLSGSGSGPYDLQWVSPGQYQVQLSVTENSCSATSLVDVLVNPIPTSLFAVNNDACIDQPVGISYNGSAAANATYNWTFGSASVLSGSGQGPYSLSWSTQGSYMISLTVTENGCVSPQTDLFATVNPLPVVYAGSNQIVCSGVTVQLGDITTPGFQYHWSPSQDLSNPGVSDPTATIQNLSNSEAIQDYYLTVTDANGCVNSDTVTVQVHPVPVVGFPKVPGQCIDNNNFNINAFTNLSTGINYNWQFSGPSNILSANTQNVNVVYSAVGTYPVQLTADYSGCPAQPFVDSVTIYEMPAPDFEPLVLDGCRPLSVPFSNLTPGNGNSYHWSFGDGGTDGVTDPLYTYNTAGVYTVGLTAVTNHGCTLDTIYPNLITVFADANANFVPSPPVANILAPIIQFQNNSTNVLTYQWDFGDSSLFSTDWSPNHTYGKVGVYQVTLMVISPNGCVDTVRGTVEVEENFSFYIPSAFSPNGDGVNDYFRGYGVAIESYSMNIYNRWGELVFKTNNYDHPWDGKLSSGPIQTDTYVYRIVLKDLHGLEHTYVGDVSVVY